MKYTIKLLLIFLPMATSCQGLPIVELIKIGLSQDEIENTSSLNGKNGINGYFLISRQKNISQNPEHKFWANYYQIFTPQGVLLPLTNPDYWAYWQTRNVYFEFLEDQVFLIAQTSALTRKICISKFDLQTGEMCTTFIGEIPCEYEKECEWIINAKRKLAFFTNLGSNTGLEHCSIYEYNWLTDELRLIYGNLGIAIDAVTGRNFALLSVKYNEEKDKFEYPK